MGKRRKSTKKVSTKKKQKISTAFKCPFCSHEMSCEVKLNRETEIGTIQCRLCLENFQCPITSLSSPIDVYGEWIDACDAAREEAGRG